jgi:hypothetical protein
VDDFVTRLKRCARRLNITDDTFHHAVLHGLRGPIRLYVLQQGVRDLQQTLRAARIAEASTAADPLTSLLLETIKPTTNMAEKQAVDIKELSAKVSALATSNNGTVAPDAYAESDQLATNAVSRNNKPAFDDNRRRDNFRPRIVKQTPQNIQRANYARQTANRKSVIQTSFRQPQTTSYDCRNCGLHHQRGECRAFGQSCNYCGKIGHFARVCRANKTTTQTRRGRLLATAAGDRRPVSIRNRNPYSMMPIFINSISARALLDTGASCCLVSGTLYRKILSKMRKPQVNSRPQTEFRRLLTADASPMEVTATLQADLKIQGLIIPFSFLVIEKLGYDCILGMNFYNKLMLLSMWVQKLLIYIMGLQ